MSNSHGNNNKPLLDAAVDCRISDEVSLLHDDEASTVTFGIGIVSENSGCSSDDNDKDIEDCNSSFVSSNKSPRYRNSGSYRNTTAFEERGEAISSDDDNERDAAQSNEKTRETPNVPKESNGKELEEGEIEDDSDDEVPIEAKREVDSLQHIKRPFLSFEIDRGEERRKRRTSFSKAANDKKDVKFRRLSTPTVEPISSDSDGTDGPQELRMRSTLGAELRRTKSRDPKTRLRT